ncbi:MAG: enoyl-CoA hydratase/isomerase family protein [Firmicutes bacterium]|nr:enoyl-CoA hydratase/isomerase family protein [Bacillota bacterium]
MFKCIKLEILDNVALITLNHPEKLNALSSVVIEELNLALDKVEGDESARALVIWGGESLFGAGADISEIVNIANSYEAYRFSRKFQSLCDRLENLPLATIAAISGYALGGCLELALACDIRVAGEKAQLGLPEIKLAVLPGGGGTQRLPRLIGTSRAKELILVGDPVSAVEAHRLGLVNRLVEEGRLYEEGMKLARTLASRAPIALAMIKNSINVGAALDMNSALEHEATCFGVLFDSEDRDEGLKAFLEKRKAVFKGR